MSGEEDNRERREIRRRYRDLINDLQENKEDLIDPERNNLKECLEQVDELFAPVTNTREAALDSQAIHLIANMGRMKVQALNTELRSFQPSEFAAKLISFVGGQSCEGARLSAQGWISLGRAVQPFLRRSPSFHYMYGSFERGPKPVKEKKERQTSEKDTSAGKATVPTQLKSFEKDSQSEGTSEEVQRVYKILRALYRKSDGNPIDYFEFVLNPDSFGHTVENIFYVSFLVKDGLAKVYLDEMKLPVIVPMEKAKPGAQKEQERQQTVISITPKEWRELVNTFEVTEACITPRASLSIRR